MSAYVEPPATPVCPLVSLESLVEPGDTSSEETEAESDEESTAAVLARVAADAARLRALLEDDDDPGAVDFSAALEFKRGDDAAAMGDDGINDGDLLRWCHQAHPADDEPLLGEIDDDDDDDDDVCGFVCPECLRVTVSKGALAAHYETAHHAPQDSWKRCAGRAEGSEGYRFGDVSRWALRGAGRLSARTRRRVARRLRRLGETSSSSTADPSPAATTTATTTAMPRSPARLAGYALGAAGITAAVVAGAPMIAAASVAAAVAVARAPGAPGVLDDGERREAVDDASRGPEGARKSTTRLPEARPPLAAPLDPPRDPELPWNPERRVDIFKK